MPVGDSCQVILSPPDWAKHWRVLRSKTAFPTAYNDPTAIIAYESAEHKGFIDLDVRNGETWRYAVFYNDGTVWRSDVRNTDTVVIAAKTYSTPNAMTLLRDRLFLGLKSEIAAGNLTAWSNGVATSAVPVLLAPPVIDETPFPCVTVELVDSASDERGIGDSMPTELSVNGGWEEGVGYFQSLVFAITAWSFNPDERNDFRHAIEKVLIANEANFGAAGLSRLEMRTTHREDFESFNAPMYMASIQLTGHWAFAALWTDTTAIDEINIDTKGIQP